MYKVVIKLLIRSIVNDNYKAIISIMYTVFWLTDDNYN